jgi:hypothetical protein
MANIKKSDKDIKPSKYMIIPRNQATYEEKFAVVNGRKLPFETPVMLSVNDVKAIERQKEPFQVDSNLTVYEAMEKYQVDQKKAAQIVQAQSKVKDMGKTIKWRSKYILQSM